MGYEYIPILLIVNCKFFPLPMQARESQRFIRDRA